MQLFEMQGILRGKAMPADIKVGESLAEWFMRKFAERDALVAENAKLAEEVMNYARECDRITFYKDNKITDAHQMDAAKDIAAASIHTDAAIAEIEAQGAEKMFNLVGPTVHTFCNSQVARLVLEELAILATDLRAGRKG